MSVLQVDRDAGVLTLTFDRPDALNAFDDELRARFQDALDDADADDDVRCVVLTGAGNAFSAGGDVKQMLARMDDGVTAQAYHHLLVDTVQPLTERLYRLSVPTIAKVDGVAVGAGFSIALACDLTVASDEARFGATFKNLGLGPDTGLSFTLPRAAGTKRALELFYTGRIVDATEAAELNVVNHVVAADDLDAEVDALAAEIAAGPPIALAATKELVYDGLEGTMPEALAAEAKTQALLSDTRDHEEGLAAFAEGRDPVFDGE